MLQLLAVRGGKRVGIHKHVANVTAICAPAIRSVVAQIDGVGIGTSHAGNEVCQGADGTVRVKKHPIAPCCILPVGLHHHAQNRHLAVGNGAGRNGSIAVDLENKLAGIIVNAHYQPVVKQTYDGVKRIMNAIAMRDHGGDDTGPAARNRSRIRALQQTHHVVIAIGIKLPFPVPHRLDYGWCCHVRQHLSRRQISRPAHDGAACRQRIRHHGEEQLAGLGDISI